MFTVSLKFFMDMTDYLKLYQMTAKELSIRIMQDILDSTGITATTEIGTNLYRAKCSYYTIFMK